MNSLWINKISDKCSYMSIGIIYKLMADGCCYIIVYFKHSYNINIMYVSDVISEAIVVNFNY